MKSQLELPSDLQASWRKVDDSWAVAVWDGPGELEGVTVTVTNRKGEAKDVKLGELVRTEKDGRREIYAKAGKPPTDTQTGPVSTAQPKGPPTVDQPGVYESDEGIFVVKWNKEKTGLYAKKMIQTPDRLNAKGERVPIDFEYAGGAVYRLLPEQRMDVERAKALTILYSQCIACGAKLYAAESVENGIGPVCIKYFGPVVS